MSLRSLLGWLLGSLIIGGGFWLITLNAVLNGRLLAP